MKTKRIAILADIHGNSLALEAVIKDIQASGGADEHWVLGDLAALGPDPAGVMTRLLRLKNTRFVRGNTDRYVVSDDLPAPPLEEIKGDLDGIKRVVRLARSMSWTLGALAASGWLPFFERLPLEMRTALPDGTRVLAVHASPGMDDVDGIHPATTDDELRSLVSGEDVDLIVVGHTHAPFDRQIDGICVINPGSVSNPYPPDLRASYVLLSADLDGYTVEFRRADYDHEAVVAAMERLRQPSLGYVSGFMRGENNPPWVEK